MGMAESKMWKVKENIWDNESNTEFEIKVLTVLKESGLKRSHARTDVAQRLCKVTW